MVAKVQVRLSESALEAGAPPRPEVGSLKLEEENRNEQKILYQALFTFLMNFKVRRSRATPQIPPNSQIEELNSNSRAFKSAKCLRGLTVSYRAFLREIQNSKSNRRLWVTAERTSSTAK